MTEAHDVLTLALDRSVRRIDQDGRLHVAVSNLSKAQVSDYYGREIPGAEELGLDADTVYPVYRPEDELQKAVESSNNIPLMDEHIIVSADNPEKDRVAGSLGTDGEFDGTYLRNSLVVWASDSIARIESGAQKQISMAYRYVADKMSGTHKGLTYALRMRDIVFNHAALVPVGRAGPDVVVGDSELEAPPMTKRLTSKKALFAHGGIKATLAPLIAADAKPDILGALEGVNRTNFKAMKATILKRLAKDAAITADVQTALTLALDAMEKEDCGEDDEMEMDAEPDLKPGEDEDPDKKAEDEEVEEEEKPKGKDKAKDKAKDDLPKMTKASMDAAIKLAVDAAQTKTRADVMAEFNAIATAKTEVMPLVGEITAAMDSAADVYKFALDHEGVELDGTESLSALKTMTKMACDRAAPTPVFIANDAKPGTGVTDMFPGLRRLRA